MPLLDAVAFNHYVQNGPVDSATSFQYVLLCLSVTLVQRRGSIVDSVDCTTQLQHGPILMDLLNASARNRTLVLKTHDAGSWATDMRHRNTVARSPCACPTVALFTTARAVLL